MDPLIFGLWGWSTCQEIFIFLAACHERSEFLGSFSPDHLIFIQRGSFSVVKVVFWEDVHSFATLFLGFLACSNNLYQNI